MLEQYRQEIDNLDNIIIEALGKRMEVVKKVGKYKKEHNIAPLQQGRWQKVLENVVQKGKRFGLKKEFVEDVYNRIHEEALELEKL